MTEKYVILALYFLVLFLIGIVASRRIKGLSDFYVGGKKLGYWVVAFSARATGESGWLLLGVTGMGALVGVSALWIVVGEVLGVALAWYFMAKPFKRSSDEYKSITIPDYLASRFQSKTHLLRIVAATTLSLFVIIYVSAQIDATGKAFETFLGWSYFTGIGVGFGIVIIYTFFGGFLAVAWSDLFQGLIMLIGLVGLPLWIYFTEFGEAGLIGGLNEIDPSLTNIWGAGGFTFMNVITAIGLASVGMGFLGSPQVFVRFMSIKDEREVDKGRWVAILFTLLTDTAAVCIGLLGRYLFTGSTDNVELVLGSAAENVLPLMVESYLPLIISGVYMAAVMAAIMSTIDSLLVVSSSAITRDFYQQILRPDLMGKPLTQTSRFITLVLAGVALVIALSVAFLSPDRTIYWFVIFGWSGIACTFCPMMILSLFWKDYTENGAIASMITGFLCIPLFKFAMPAIPEIGIYFNQLTEMPPSFLLSFLVGIGVSKLR